VGEDRVGMFTDVGLHVRCQYPSSSRIVLHDAQMGMRPFKVLISASAFSSADMGFLCSSSFTRAASSARLMHTRDWIRARNSLFVTPLDDVAICADVESLCLVVGGDSGPRHEDHKSTLQSRFGLDPPAYLNACHVGKHDVEEDYARMLQSHGIQALMAGSGSPDIISFVCEKGGE
jgi:hypothetical protein